MKKDLYLVRGLPGSGKSTFAKSIAKSWQIFEADQFFMKDGEYNFDGSKIRLAHESCKRRVLYWMHPSLFNWLFFRKIVVSNTFTQEWEMKFYEKIAEKYGYTVHVVIVENRHDGHNEHGVPEEKIQQMKNRFEIKL